MGEMDDTAQKLKGKAKEAAGTIKGDRGERNEGRADQAKADVKKAAREARDALKP